MAAVVSGRARAEHLWRSRPGDYLALASIPTPAADEDAASRKIFMWGDGLTSDECEALQRQLLPGGEFLAWSGADMLHVGDDAFVVCVVRPNLLLARSRGRTLGLARLADSAVLAIADDAHRLPHELGCDMQLLLGL